MGSKVRFPYLLFALVVAAFVVFYPQLDAAGYCDGNACPEVSTSAHGVGSGAGGAGGSAISFVVAALVGVSGALFFYSSRSTLVPWGTDVLFGITLPPEVPPPRPSQ